MNTQKVQTEQDFTSSVREHAGKFFDDFFSNNMIVSEWERELINETRTKQRLRPLDAERPDCLRDVFKYYKYLFPTMSRQMLKKRAEETVRNNGLNILKYEPYFVAFKMRQMRTS